MQLSFRFIVMLLLLLTLSGCWDRTEIEDVGFIMGIGLDPVQDDEQSKQQTNNQKPRTYKFRSTYQMAVPSKIGSQGAGQKGQPFFTITEDGSTNFKQVRNIAARTSRKPNFEHLKVLLVNQELARDGILKPMFDFYLRDHEMRRHTQIYISSAPTIDILKIKLPLAEILAQSLYEMGENYSLVLEEIEPTDVGTISEQVIGERSFLISRILLEGEERVKLTGAAIFNGYSGKMVGWLGGKDIIGYNFISGQGLNGVLELDFKGNKVNFEVLNNKTVISYEKKNDKDTFSVEINVEGALGESWAYEVPVSEEKMIKELEKSVVKEIKDHVTAVVDKMQQEFHSDIFDLHNKVRTSDYRYWQKAKKDWDKENGGFAKSEINVKVHVTIRHYMLNERMED
ncbi:Ger(x)C family spore germination protein [Caldalkalibacillus salinus]|uniref:Ger(x)C family spore germination protein n=1 Tax=Caldalkalibacillus salinus TaxID=2803787 RepID=UPI001924A614|nr:Ger(x)C family spore germination protein [Caldalkalibacillus salinus]